MAITGAMVNALAIVVGALLGLALKRIPERMKTTMMQAISLCIIVLGVQMALKGEQFLVMISSLVIGSLIGEALHIEKRLQQLGQLIERRIGAAEEGTIARGFVAATLLFVIGAMAVIGAMDSGLRHDHTVLYTKALIDGIASIMLASTLGIGVALSAVPILLWEGGLALLATEVSTLVPPSLLTVFIREMTGAGGVMIAALGLNVLGVTNVRVANMLPAIAVVAVIVTALHYL